MPYVVNDRREDFDPEIDRVVNQMQKAEMDDREGDANYVVSRILAQTFDLEDGTIRYKHINRAIGVLECVKQELYRRIAAPYENQAIEKNGDIKEYKDMPITTHAIFKESTTMGYNDEEIKQLKESLRDVVKDVEKGVSNIAKQVMKKS